MSNASAIEMGNTPAYQTKLMNLLGQRDPIETLSATPDAIDRFTRENDAATLRRRPHEGKWTPNEIIGHLVDAEIIYLHRVRQIFCEERPLIGSTDQDLWVSRQRHNERVPAELAAEFRSLRKMTLRLWRMMTPEDLKRTGCHSERGEESLGVMIRMHAGHDLSHIDQITRYLAAIRNG